MIARRSIAGVIALTMVTSLSAPIATLARPVTAEGALRKELLDTLRKDIVKELGAPIVFVVEKAAVEGDWAFVLATPWRSPEVPVDWEKTICAGDVSHLVGALLKRENGTWSVKSTALCPTDVAWETWPKDYGAPAAIFD